MAAYLIVQHSVEDFEKWKPVFDDHGEVRKKHGARGHRLYRSTQDPNTLAIVTEFESVEGARAFMEDPSLRETMERAGVSGPPNIWLTEEAESVQY